MNRFILSIMLAACTINAISQPNVANAAFSQCNVDTIPAITHIIEMKVSGDTLYFVYENEDSFGQLYLGSYTFDRNANSLCFDGNYGQTSDGYWLSYMPYPFTDCDGNMTVADMDDCRLYNSASHLELSPSDMYLLTSSVKTPYPLSLHATDIFQTGKNTFIFIGRQPKGGMQSVLKTDCRSMTVDEIMPLVANTAYTSWIVNTGELAFLRQRQICAYAYRLFPKIDFFDIESNRAGTVTVASDTFDPATIDLPDTESINTLHFVDLTQTDDNVYALYWGMTYSDAIKRNAKPAIYRFTPDSSIDVAFTIEIPIFNIAAVDNRTLIAWTGNSFITIHLP